MVQILIRERMKGRVQGIYGISQQLVCGNVTSVCDLLQLNTPSLTTNEDLDKKQAAHPVFCGRTKFFLSSKNISIQHLFWQIT